MTTTAKLFRFTLALLAMTCVLRPAPSAAHGDVHGRIEEFTLQLKTQPTNAEIYLARAELYRLDQNWKLAAEDFDAAFRADPKMVVVDFCRGRMWLEANDPKQAIGPLDKFLAQEPGHVDALESRARVRAKLGDPLGAAQDYTRAIALTGKPRPEFFIERSQALAAAGGVHVEEAVRGLDEGIKALGPLVTLQLPAIDLELAQKHYDAALGRLVSLAAQSQRKESWHLRRGEILEMAGRPAEARQAYADALASLAILPDRIRQNRATVELETRVRTSFNRLSAVANTPK